MRFMPIPVAKTGRGDRTERYRLVEWKNHSDENAPVDYELYDYKSDPWRHKTITHQAKGGGKAEAILPDIPPQNPKVGTAESKPEKFIRETATSMTEVEVGAVCDKVAFKAGKRIFSSWAAMAKATT